MTTNIDKLINACDMLTQRCTTIANTRHGSAWLFDRLMREFDKCSAVEAITIPVFLNAPLMCEGEAEIHRDGTLVIRRA